MSSPKEPPKFQVRADRSGEQHIYLRDWNVRVATFSPGVTQTDKDEIARLLKAGWTPAAEK